MTKDKIFQLANKNKNSAKRLDYIDAVKAIGIWIIVLGHALTEQSKFKVFTYGFHVPVFFAVYGMTYKPPKTVKDLGQRLIKRAVSYVIPYFIWAMVYAKLSVKSLLFIAYGSNTSLNAGKSMGVLWFLSTYFIVCIVFEVVMFFCLKLKGGEIFAGIALGALCVLGYFLGKITICEYLWPWNFDVALASLLFPYFGYLLKKYLMPIAEKKLAIAVVFLILGLGLSFLTFVGGASAEYGYVRMVVAQYGSFPLFILTGCAGTLFLTMLSHFLIKVKYLKELLCFIGQNSLIIMIVHREFSFFIRAHFTENTFLYAALAAAVTLALACFSFVVVSIVPQLGGKFGKMSIKLFKKQIEIIK